MTARRLLIALGAMAVAAILGDDASSAEGELRLILGDFLNIEGGSVQALTVENRSSMRLRSANIRCQFAALNRRTHLSEDIVGWGEASVLDIGAGDKAGTEVVEFHYEDRTPADHTHCLVEKASWG